MAQHCLQACHSASPAQAAPFLECLSWFRLRVAWAIAMQMGPVHHAALHASPGTRPFPFHSDNTEQ
jgi:hypothetical protein